MPGSGTLTGSGTATRLDVTVDGSGSVQFMRLAAGSIFLTATRRLDASVSGSGSILYAGSPRDVIKNVTGSGAIAGS